MTNSMLLSVPCGILLLARICNGQVVLPSPTQHRPISRLPPPSHSSPLPADIVPDLSIFGPGNRTVNGTDYHVICEYPPQAPDDDAAALADSITDFGSCLELCNRIDDCKVAFFDPSLISPCELLTSLDHQVAATPKPPGRCYAAKIPSDSTLPSVSVSLPISPVNTISIVPGGATSLSSIRSRIPTTLSSILSLSILSSSPSSSSSSGSASASSSSSSSNSSSSSSSSTSSSASTTLTLPLRTNAYCGTSWGKIPFPICPPNDDFWGPCCSHFGFCGFGPNYCGVGCQLPFGNCGSDFASIPGPVVVVKSSAQSSAFASILDDNNNYPTPPFRLTPGPASLTPLSHLASTPDVSTGRAPMSTPNPVPPNPPLIDLSSRPSTAATRVSAAPFEA